jgi:hypothetical protein
MEVCGSPTIDIEQLKVLICLDCWLVAVPVLTRACVRAFPVCTGEHGLPGLLARRRAHWLFLAGKISPPYLPRLAR